MIYEKSCGAIVYTLMNKEIYYLIIQSPNGHYSFPKGHVENEETEQETAFREVQEETGLAVELKDGFRQENQYSPYENCQKQVVYFVAYSKQLRTTPQQGEVIGIQWLMFDEAYAKLSFRQDKALLIKANEYVETLEK